MVPEHVPMVRDHARADRQRARCGPARTLALLTALLAPAGAAALEFEPQPAEVTHVVDGDTFVLRFPDSTEPRIEYSANLIGVDAPGEGEAECAAPMVGAVPRRLLLDREVWVEWDRRDRRTGDGRLLVYIHHPDVTG